MTGYYLPNGLAAPVAAPDGLDAPYWEGLREGALRIQKCHKCGTWQWGPEWVCHNCHSTEMGWEETPPVGRIYSWQRMWHPVHPALTDYGPYVVVLVELPAAGNVRVLGNLLGDPRQPVEIGTEVVGEFEHHGGEHPHVLLQWRLK